MPIPETTEIEVPELEELRRRDRHHARVLELLVAAGHLDPARLEQAEAIARDFFDQED